MAAGGGMEVREEEVAMQIARHYGKRSLHFMTKDCSIYSAGAILPYISPQATK